MNQDVKHEPRPPACGMFLGSLTVHEASLSFEAWQYPCSIHAYPCLFNSARFLLAVHRSPSFGEGYTRKPR
ncbi:hypothetical protein PENSTE_c004G02686 [Penicillium steckii]|uniref:Uncharacterized protein n=1 Tax=Penicillium steckii TaxID=303698 RepID=A0A1V6TMA5_9EURO|nr:hypothetical protein PENSTE_c004G02686 [Penicillium steckii]